MKNLNYLVMTLTLFAMTSFAQQQEQYGVKPPKFEVSFNALKLAVGEGFYLSSDYFLNESSSVGLVGGFQDDELNKGINEFKIGTNYKHYFSKKHTEGFYASSGLSYNYKKHNYMNYQYYQEIPNNYTETNNLNFDFNLGYKLVSERGFSLDAFVGLSHTLLSDIDWKTTNLNYGIKLGKRF